MQHTPASAEDFRQELAVLRQKFHAMQPELEVTVRDLDMGVEGFVVVWNTEIGREGPLPHMGKGGTRVTKDLTLDQIKRLARAMAEKNAAAGLPLGGAKSGLRLDPSDPAYEKKYRRFVELCAPLLHERGGIFGGFGYDVGCVPPKNAIWACEQLNSKRCFTGKPIEMGGTNYDVEGIAGLGVAVAAKTLLEEYGEVPKGKTFSVQGMGAMGAAVTRYFSEFGGTLRCMSDPKYGGTWVLHNPPSPALINSLSQQKKDEALKLLHAEGKKISDDSADALYAGADVLFPCAMEDVLHKDNAALVRARYMAEGANNPTTEEAHQILFKKGVKVVPDIIANSGGIIAAFVELASKVSLEENMRTHAKVIEAKEMTITRISKNVQQLALFTRDLGVEADQAADYIAYRNIFKGLQKP